MRSRYREQWKARLSFNCFVAAFAGIILLYQRKQQAKKLKLLYAAARDGSRLDASKSIPDVLHLLKQL